MSAPDSVLETKTADLSRLGVVQSRPMSYEEFLDWEPEGGLTEWIDGQGVQYMAATNIHQRVVNLLITLVSLFVSLHGRGRVFSGPYAMRARPDGNVREPDLFVVLVDNRGEETRNMFLGAPDIVVEVISDDSVYRDRVTKFDEYEAAGVREYWLIDPRPHRKRADFYVLDATGRFQSIPLGTTGIFRSTVLDGFWLDADWLWQEEPNVAQIYEMLRSERR